MRASAKSKSPSEISTAKFAPGLFEGGVYNRQIIKSLRGPLVEVVHLRVGFCVLLVGLAQAALLIAQDLLQLPEVGRCILPRRSKIVGRTQETINRQLTVPSTSRHRPVFFNHTHRQLIKNLRVTCSFDSCHHPNTERQVHRRYHRKSNGHVTFSTACSGPLS